MRAVAVSKTQKHHVFGFVLPLFAFLAFALSMIATQARSAPDSFADLAERLSPAVVNITTKTAVAQTAQRPIVPEGSPLEDFFEDFMDRQEDGRPPRQGSALGAGFVISEDGFIVTNNHVIEEANEIFVEFFDGKELEATLVGTDPKTDIAVLKVEADAALPFVTFGDSDIARVGDWVMAIGNPLGQGFSVSVGIISARNRFLRGSYDDFIQTDAAINRGNSGGPLFNMEGEVIGVNTAILSPNGGSIGIGFAMSSGVVKNVVRQLRDFGETKRGWLGVRIQDVGEDEAEALGLDGPGGALVTDVPDGPAKEGGISVGDVILSFDGQDIEDTRGLVRIVGDTEVGKSVRVLVFRDGGTETLLVEVGRLETASLAAPSEDDKVAPVANLDVVGMTLSPLSEALRAEFGIADSAEGIVVIAIDEESDAFTKGVRVGDVIVEVAQQKISAPSELAERLTAAAEAGRRSILLLVRRDGQPQFVPINPAP